ncbi:hypothetical protein JAAARDRAFT_53456 [Jaapia argillacea MUCL 33604]|uniref:Acyl-CoA desaturase n=1 Tax=Jaapia argillacea MUCL 33604 TaxID=933084 RepID=A0A067Q8C2_9AGAM|nr:hypothetical protein JAAARDRAFT_53456 [Jaapia argillacea MUCL 33604]
MLLEIGAPEKEKPPQSKIWWSNSIFFVSAHLAAAIGVLYRPYHLVPLPTLLLVFFTWQAACFGITIGYHRLWSHRAFRATLVVRLALAALGSSAFQGSIKWWCLRHRLHHRFTDDPQHDPYAATRGLLFSHMGWIFYKPSYSRMELVDREDLDSDPVVRLQHKYFVPLAVVFGFGLPILAGSFWNDALGAFIWAGLVSRLLIWHCTFLVNSLAHWDGLQPYSDENTSRGTLLLALLTAGEGNHNFHAFPHDFRSGPSLFDWDPSKWMILALHQLGLVTSVRRARNPDIQEAKMFMAHGLHEGVAVMQEGDSRWDGEEWDTKSIQQYLQDHKAKCLLLINGFVIDGTGYLKEHPGGSALLRKYSIRMPQGNGETVWRDATWAYDGGLNNHSRAAKRRMRELRVARFKP